MLTWRSSIGIEAELAGHMNRNCENIINHLGYCRNPPLKSGNHRYFWEGRILNPNPIFLRAFFYDFKLNAIIAMLPIGNPGQGQHSLKAMKLRCMPGIYHFVQSNTISKLDVTVTLFEVPLGHIEEKGAK